MKKGFIFLAICLWSIVIVAIIFAAILISSGRMKNYMITAEALLKHEEISLDNTKNIIIETSRHSIQIRKTNEDKIKVSQYGNPDSMNEELFMVSSSSDGVHIYIKKAFHLEIFSLNMYKEALIVEIPEDFKGNLDASASSGSIKIEDDFELSNVKLSNSSGNTRIYNSLVADSLNVNSSSGSIKFNGIVTANNVSAKANSGSIRSTMGIKANGNLDLNTSSGSIDIDNDTTSRDLYAHTNSGSIRMANVYVEEYNIKSTSGSIKIDNITGGGHVKTTSGGIRLELNSPKGDIDVTSSSGSIRLALESSLQFTLNAQTSSGSIKTNFATQKNDRGNFATANIGDNPTANITAMASSGGIRVEN